MKRRVPDRQRGVRNESAHVVDISACQDALQADSLPSRSRRLTSTRRLLRRLGDVFVEVAAQEHKQLLLATHSDHLLLSLLNNVAERKLAADDLAIYYFQLEDGKATANRQEVTDDGLVKGGLPGFFDAALEAQRRHLDAVTKHQPLEAVAQQP